MKHLTTWVVTAAALFMFTSPVYAASHVHHSELAQTPGIHVITSLWLNEPDWLE